MLDKNFTKTYTVGGLEVEIDIAPCCWMYNSPFQLRAKLLATGQFGNLHAYHIGMNLSFENATEDDMDRMVQQMVFIVVPCSCGNPRMLIKGETSNRGELCETCFGNKLTAELEKAQEEDKKRVAKKDREMAMDGYTHKVTAWIHPSRGGSDYMVDIYFRKEPTKDEIVRHLKSSHVKDDYRVEPLPSVSEEDKVAFKAAQLKKAGLTADPVGETITIQEKTFTVVNVDPKDKKKGVHIKDDKGANYTCSIDTLKKALKVAAAK